MLISLGSDKAVEAEFKKRTHATSNDVIRAVVARACMALHQPGAGKAPAMSPAQIFELADRYFEWNAEDWKKATQGTVLMTSLLAFVRAATESTATAPVSQPAAQEKQDQLVELAAALEQEWLAKVLGELRLMKFHDPFHSGFQTALDEIEARCGVKAWDAEQVEPTAPQPITAPAGSEQETN